MTGIEIMEKKLAFVLSGGGARGALQVGALYALLEAGLQPDMLVGASIGAVNSAFLSLNGFTCQSLDNLKAAWLESVHADLLPSNYVWLAVRAMFGRSSTDPARRIRDFFIAHGLHPQLRFSQLARPQLVIVSTDLNTGEPVLHGLTAEENVLDALLVSTALPPWFMPVKERGRYLMDGGLVSNLPVEPAIRAGATQIIALNLLDTEGSQVSQGFGMPLPEFLDKMAFASEKRQTALELELAAAYGYPTMHVRLAGEKRAPFWDFSKAEEMIEQGYQITKDMLEEQQFPTTG